MILTRILGSRAKVALLGALFEQDDRTGRALSGVAGVSASTGKEALGDLVGVGVVLQSGTSGRHQYEVNRSHGLCDHLEQLFAFERSIPQRVAKLVRPVAGSHALRGVAVEAGAVTLYGTTALRIKRADRERLGHTLYYALGLTLEAITTDGSVPVPGPGRWVLDGPVEVGTPAGTRRRSVLGFFGLDDRNTSEVSKR